MATISQFIWLWNINGRKAKIQHFSNENFFIINHTFQRNVEVTFEITQNISSPLYLYTHLPVHSSVKLMFFYEINSVFNMEASEYKCVN